MYSTLCLEYYHGMTLHDTVCARCHNEVRSPFSLVRALTDIHMQTAPLDVEHRHNSANHADPGKITPELHDIIDCITQIEEMLRSRSSPCFVMRVSKNDQCFSLPLDMDSRRSRLC